MATNKQAIWIAKAVNSGITLNNASGTTASTLITANTTFGSAATGIFATSNGTTGEVVVDLTYNDGSSDFIIGSTAVPQDSGTDGSTAGVNLLNSTIMPALVADGSFTIGAGHSLKVNAQTTITSGSQIDIVAEYGDFGE